MSESFNAVHQAIKTDPELAAKVRAADAGEDRAAVLRDAGLPVPTQAEVESGVAALGGISGGQTTVGDIQDASYGGEAAASGLG